MGLNFLNNRLAVRHLFYVLGCSTFLAIISTCIQLYIDFRRDLEEIDDDLKMIETSYIPSIVSSRYNLDRKQTQLLLDGIRSLRDIIFVEIIETRAGRTRTIASSGEAMGSGAKIKNYPLFQLRENQRIPLGDLKVQVSLHSVYARLKSRVIVIVVSNIFKFFLMSFFILWIVHSLTVRHLKRIADFTGRLDISSFDQKINLQRKTVTGRRRDELDEIVDGINSMITRIRSDVEIINSAMQTQKTLNLQLQGKNSELTLEIERRSSAEIQLRESESRFALAMDAAREGLWDYHLDTGEIYYSPRWFSMLGYGLDELPREFETWRKLVHPEDLACMEKTIRRYKVLDRPFEIEFRMKTREKPVWKYILCRGKTVERDLQGTALRMLGTHMDISERKIIENQLQQAQKVESIGVLAGGIAHDFNNILFPIVGMSELLMMGVSADSREFHRAEEIHKAAMRGSDLVKQILNFSRQSDMQLIPVSLQQILKETLQFLRSSIPANIVLQQNIQKSCPPVKADPIRIHQLIMNLITNASHAVEPEDGEISIVLDQVELSLDDVVESSGAPGTYVCLEISDSGCGMDRETLEKIFDPYFTTKKQGKGTGLGLFVVYGIVKEFKGILRVHSEPFQGTSFKIFLPAITELTESVSGAAADEYLTGTEHILLVDDEDVVLETEKEMLTSLGYRVTGCRGGRQALDLFQKAPDAFDLVITDLAMPLVTGEQLVEALLSIKPAQPVIVCTGFAARRDGEENGNLGVRGTLSKPIVISELARVVRGVLDQFS